MSLTCFKSYDIRGRIGVDLDADIARRIGRAFAEVLDARQVVLGRDIRNSSPELAAAVAAGLTATGVQVLDLGICGTEEVYFATGALEANGGIMVTASHNPIDYNGMKLVKAGAAPLDPVQDLKPIKALAESAAFAPDRAGGAIHDRSGTRAAYVERVLSFVDVAALRPLHILVNAGNGAAGPTFDALATALEAAGAPLRFTRMHHAPDGSFPNGIPNPLLTANQPATAEAVRQAGADMGIAWDGDFDRCFFFDATGRFIPGEHIVGLLARAFLTRAPGAAIAYDPRVVLSTRDIIARAGGRAVQANTGHVNLKAALRSAGAVYGGEMSAHHYFRDFYCCDSGMIPWLLVAELLGRTGESLAGLVDEQMRRFPSSGEINFQIDDPAAAIARVEAAMIDRATARDDSDGLSLEFPGGRFNLRRSNTEPLVRLNVETRGDPALLDEMTAQITRLLEG
ncbi:phosphomannomutase [Frigidibacter sp. ROC022]|uniref:phosphomannomutase n=1 Tax=Frigidibacter sp. ROC022 TaxID=2971796 RepID=UPI00215AF7F7|nr:phosphomannomutase [Frigidibacter sp. ROC022]MCR8724391.1 phosphomannomutase [Frigidibacter sp. ROC022]